MTLPRKPPPKRDWTLANQKRTMACRVCGRTDRPIELAHVIGRKVEIPEAVETKVDGRLVRLIVVRPDRVVPLCGPAIDPASCHGAYDSSQLDLWGYLTKAERWQAIEDAGGLGQALRRCAPLSWQNQVEVVDGEAVERTMGGV